MHTLSTWFVGYRNSTVFTESDFNEFYGPNNVGEEFLRTLLSLATFMFIGYGFSDPFIDKICRDVASRPWWRFNHFALIGADPNEDLDEKLKNLADAGIEPIFYPMENDDHSNLQIVLDALHAYDCELVDSMC